MSSILPPLDTAPSIVNVGGTIVFSTDETIAEGDTLYASSMESSSFLSSTYGGLAFLYSSGSEDNAQLVNNGTIRGLYTAESSTFSYHAFLVRSNAYMDIVNSGKAILEVMNGQAYGLLFGRHLTNDGEVDAYAYSGSAFAIFTENGLRPTVVNSGLVASYAGTGSAYGITLGNGGTLSNLASGKILAEGVDARAVDFAHGTYNFIYNGTPEITNAGLIEAHSLDPAHASIAIYASPLEIEDMRIVNSGTIRGDYAIYADSYAFSPPQKSAETVTNESGGQIEGNIFLDLGDDTVVNHGNIVGDIQLGEGNDQFDTQTGTWSGLASLGFGNDIFLGSAGNDVVRGEWGDDRLEGNAGQDLLLGDRGNDTLIGGAGNDGLYGEQGDDLIVTAGGDYVLAGSGNDRVELGDYTFSNVDGGSGTDTLVLPNTGKILDLSAALAGGRISHFENIVLPGAQQIVIRDADVLNLADDGTTLTVSAGPSSKIFLVGAWIDAGTQSIDGVSYHAFQLRGETVLAQSGATVSVVGTAPPGTSGLDAIHGGPDAPLPGSVPGTGLTTDNTLANDFLYLDPLVIEQGEVWFSTNGTAVLGTWSPDLPSLTNNGSIVSASEYAPLPSAESIQTLEHYLSSSGLINDAATGLGAVAVDVMNSGLITNNGLISATSIEDGCALGISVGAFGSVLNQGNIQVQAENLATGISTYESQDPFTNNGELRVESTASLGLGVFLGNTTTVVNNGAIEISGALGAIAITGNSVFSVVNTGTITAVTTEADGSPSIAFLIYANSPMTIDNSGTIEADELLTCYGTDVAAYGLI